MRVFLVQTAQGLTSSSGGYKANISLLRQLRGFSHEAAQICYGWDKEVDRFAQVAAEKGVEPNVTKSVVNVVDPQGEVHDLVIQTFSDEDKIHNIVVSGDQFNEAYPLAEFVNETKDYLEVCIASVSSVPCSVPSVLARSNSDYSRVVRCLSACTP